MNVRNDDIEDSEEYSDFLKGHFFPRPISERVFSIKPHKHNRCIFNIHEPGWRQNTILYTILLF